LELIFSDLGRFSTVLPYCPPPGVRIVVAFLGERGLIEDPRRAMAEVRIGVEVEVGPAAISMMIWSGVVDRDLFPVVRASDCR